jgi:hypothetical protein
MLNGGEDRQVQLHAWTMHGVTEWEWESILENILCRTFAGPQLRLLKVCFSQNQLFSISNSHRQNPLMCGGNMLNLIPASFAICACLFQRIYGLQLHWSTSQIRKTASRSRVESSTGSSTSCTGPKSCSGHTLKGESKYPNIECAVSAFLTFPLILCTCDNIIF